MSRSANLSLKQRLTALSLSSSAPAPTATNAPDSPRSPGFRAGNLSLKAGFKTPWAKRANTSDNFGGRDSVQDVMSTLIFQAGVDYETRPMVVLNASALPDPRDVSYDILLSRILSYLDLYVESDYTVVFFTAGGRHTPGWNWIWKAYRSLNRKYRKNLKKLFIVHSSFFSKMLFSLAGAIISPKFFRKIAYINTLSELACHVPLTQIDIPRAVYQENLKFEKQIQLPIPSRSNVFGIPLEELMGHDGEKGGVPRVVKDCVIYLRETGLEEEGLFRRSPNSAMLKQAKDAYDRGQVVSLQSFGDPHLAAVLLKKYLRDLPSPIFPEALYPVIKRTPPPIDDVSELAAIEYIRNSILPQLSPCTYILLNNILHLLHDVSQRSTRNRMDAYNLAIVVSPNLVSSSNPMLDVSMCAVAGSSVTDAVPGNTTLGTVIRLCIQHYYEIFDEILDRSEAVLPRKAEDLSASLPEGHEGRLLHDDDDEDIDDAMLVMPIGPSASNSGNAPTTASRTATATTTPPSRSNTSPPAVWTAKSGEGTTVSVPYQPRTRTPKSTTSRAATRSVQSASKSVGSGLAYASQSKARSVINIEKGIAANGGTASRKGSISIGRGTAGKSSGAGVEALGITAEGFFMPPSSAPPVPSPPSAYKRR